MILKAIEEQIFYPLAMTCSDIEKDLESTAYSGYNFTLTHLNVKFRLSKITPAKTGQFVTLWKRDKYGETVAFDYHDPFDFYIIAASKDQHDGMFIFPKKTLLEKGILSYEKKTGKRGFRVYPSWDTAENQQAQKTQKWQIEYFLEFSGDRELMLKKASLLLCL